MRIHESAVVRRRGAQKAVEAPDRLFPQVLGEPNTIVREHHPVTCLCGVQIDIGRYREIAVAFRIVENLAHMPYVGRFLPSLADR